MFRQLSIIITLVVIVLFASGCRCVGPSYQPCGVSCDPCSDTCDSGVGDCDVTCGQTCGIRTTSRCMPYFCLPNPLVWVGGLFHRACQCDSGCGEMYWGGWYGNPPRCDPCDPCGNCMQTAGIPRRTDQRMLTASSPAPRRAPTKAAPTPVMKSPQAMRPYYNRKQR